MVLRLPLEAAKVTSVALKAGWNVASLAGQLIALTLSPSERESRDVVVIFDCDGRLDLVQIKQILVDFNVDAGHSYLPLKRGRLLNFARSPLQDHILFLLATAMAALPLYHSTRMLDEQIALIVVDSLTALQVRTRSDLKNNEVSKSADLNPSIASLAHQFACPIVVSTWVLSSNELPSGYLVEPCFSTLKADSKMYMYMCNRDVHEAEFEILSSGTTQGNRCDS